MGAFGDIGDRVGTSAGFLKLPHSQPLSEREHAANAREVERVINNIPLGSQGAVVDAYAESGTIANNSTYTFSGFNPLDPARWVVEFSVTGVLTTADPGEWPSRTILTVAAAVGGVEGYGSSTGGQIGSGTTSDAVSTSVVCLGGAISVQVGMALFDPTGAPATFDAEFTCQITAYRDRVGA